MMTANSNSLCVTSFNSTGFSLSSRNYIRSLLLFSDVCCVQEHFLLDCNDRKYSNTDKLKTELGASCDMHIQPAVKNNSEIF